MNPVQSLRYLQRRPPIAWLVLALVCAPLIGHWHQTAHALPQHPQQGHPADHGAALWADHSHADCLLLDQLALGDAPPGTATLALPAPAPTAAPPAHRAAAPVAQHAAPFQARGPPAGALQYS